MSPARMKGPLGVEARRKRRRARLRKSMSSLHLVLNAVLILLLWAMVNYLSVRNGFREDWSRQQVTVLSPQTESILESLDQTVNVISFMEDSFRARDELDELLNELQLRTDAVSVERVDPDRDLGRATELMSDYSLQTPNQLVIASGNRQTVLSMEAMIVMESDEERQMGEAPRMIGFRGEAMVAAALVRMTRGDRPNVYTLTGHGQKDIDDFSEGLRGFSDVRERLQSEHVDVHPLNLETTREVPEDADALIIAGPETRISQPELDLLREYMNRNGRVMIMVDDGRNSGLEPLLRDFGVRLDAGRVLDPQRTLVEGTVHVMSYGDHPVTQAMNGIRTVFFRPRGVLPIRQEEENADRPQFVALALSSDAAWSDRDPVAERGYTEGTDLKGPVPVMAAVEAIGVVDEDGRGPARLVVVGDSDFAANWLNNGAGALLVQHSLNWLLSREDLIEIPARDVEEIRLQMDRRGLNRLLLEVAVLLPMAVAAMGFWMSWRRRV